MSTTTTQLTSPSRLARVFFTAAFLAICTTLIFGVNWAFADGDPAAPTYPGENKSQELFIGVVPENTDDFTFGSYKGESGTDTSYTEATSPSGTEFTRDANNVAHVYIESEVGKSVDLAAGIAYMRVGNSILDMSSTDSQYLPVTDFMHEDHMIVYADDAELAQPGYFMYSWYVGDAPLSQGVYTTSDSYQTQNPETMPVDTSATTIGTEPNAISALHFTRFAGDLERNYGSLDNRIIYGPVYTFEPVGNDNSKFDYPYFGHGYYYSTFPLSESLEAPSSGIYFETAGNGTYTMQATYAHELRQIRNVDGVDYTFISYKVYASNPVVFHINVKSADTATLVFSAVDYKGDPVDISDKNNFNLYLSKQYKGGTSADAKPAQFVQVPCWSTTYTKATTGVYKFNVVDKYGNYIEFEENIEVTAAEIAAAKSSGDPVVKTIVLRKVSDPVQHTVSFVDEDGTTVLLAARKYNKNTLGSVVDSPETPTKNEDDDNLYVFKWWEVEVNGTKTHTTSPLDVTGDMVYRAVYTAVPKNNDLIVNNVYAAGSLFSGSKPAGVSSYSLTVDTPSDDKLFELAQQYAPIIGNNRMAAVYDVNLIQYNTDGTTESPTEGLGDMSLDFPIDGVADGTKIKIIQLHVVGDSVKVIEHNNLIVKNGKAHVNLDGRLSTFIITIESDGQSSDPTSNPQNTDEPVNNSSDNPANTNGSSGNNSSGSSADSTAGGSSNSNASENATGDASSADGTLPMVKTGSEEDASDDSKPAETGDETNMLLLMLMAMTALGAAYAIRRRRKAQAFSS